MSEYKLHEFGTKTEFSGNTTLLEEILQNIWERRERQPYFRDKESDEEREDMQHLLSVLRHSNGTQIKGRNYVGIIKYWEEGTENTINIYPKIMEGVEKEALSALFQNNLIFWLSYCKYLRLPNYKSSLDTKKEDLLQVLIYYFSKYTKELFATSLYQNYIEIRRELGTVRGRIDMPEYIRRNLSTGRWHRISCVYQQFQLDNRFNRIVKHVARLLLPLATDSITKKNLRDIIYVLDEVKDIHCTPHDCDKVRFNQMFREFETVLSYCRLFLTSSISYHDKSRHQLFAFLLDMNALFEDFIAGFVERHLPHKNYRSQSKGTNLTTKSYELKPDFINDECIIDTKYKSLVDQNSVSQADLYQLVTYAIRHKRKHLTLLYPLKYGEREQSIAHFEIKDEFDISDDYINIYIKQIDIILREDNTEESIQSNLNQIFI